MSLYPVDADLLAELANEMDQQDDVHPDGYPATRDGVFLGIQTAVHELDVEAMQAWRAERSCNGWSKTRVELMQAAAVIMRTISAIDHGG